MNPLTNLFLGYLNQDWKDEYESIEAAISSFLSEADASTVADACFESRKLLEADLGEDALKEELLVRHHCGYWPPSDGKSFSQFMEYLTAKLCGPVT
jgi:hypothetical protein